MSNADENKQFIKKRGTYKAQITNFKRFLEDYKTKEPGIIKLNIRSDRLKSSFVEFDNISDRLDLLDEGTDHASERFEIENNYLECLTAVEHLKLEATSYFRSNFSDNVDGQNTFIERSSPAAVTKRRVKLPEASLPKFSGKYEDCLSFRDAFTSMIHSQSDLNNIEKLQYLKSAVTGEASNKIKNVSITDGNYDRAWKLLQNAYADKSLIIARHVSLLLRLPVQNKESAEGLRRLADETQQHLESLKSLDIAVTEEIVVQILEEKLHRATAEKWEETLKRDTFPRLDEMIDFLYKVASRLSKRGRDETEQTSGQSAAAKNAFQKQNKNKFQSRQTSRQAFLSTTNKACPICREKIHPVYKCETFRNYSIPERTRAAKSASLCLNFLRTHGEKPCNFSKCLLCGQAHNTLLHESKEQGSQPQI